MDRSELTAISPLDGRYHHQLASLRTIFSEYGLIKSRVAIEAHWLMQLTTTFPDLSSLVLPAKQVLTELLASFSTEQAHQIKSIELEINHDVKAVEYYIKKHLAAYPELSPMHELVHFGCTSEDINNLAYGLMLMEAREHTLLPAFNALLDDLRKFSHQYAELPMLARTHGQAASPTTVGKEIANVLARLSSQINQFTQLPIWGKFNGATGNFNALTIACPEFDWLDISKNFVSRLGLSWNGYTTQIEPHDGISEYFSILQRINTIMIDFCRDVWGYIALDYFQLKTVAKEVGSSTMPHKINPIDFENAEGNLGIANALFHHFTEKLPISRWQRDLSDSTVLRNMGVALGHALLAYQALHRGCKKLVPNVAKLAADLDQHWEILAEAVQMVMRRSQLKEPYEQLKTFSRGKAIDQVNLHAFINELPLSANIKQRLLTLSPSTYLGYAEKLARQI